MLGMKTRKASLRRAIKALSDWCRRHRHRPLEEQHAALTRRLRGHYNYFGINGNAKSLGQLNWASSMLALGRRGSGRGAPLSGRSGLN